MELLVIWVFCLLLSQPADMHCCLADIDLQQCPSAPVTMPGKWTHSTPANDSLGIVRLDRTEVVSTNDPLQMCGRHSPCCKQRCATTCGKMCQTTKATESQKNFRKQRQVATSRSERVQPATECSSHSSFLQFIALHCICLSLPSSNWSNPPGQAV